MQVILPTKSCSNPYL